MAKKRKNPFEDDLENDDFWMSGSSESIPPLPGVGLEVLKPLTAGMSHQDGLMLFTMMSHMVESGVTPRMYEAFHNAFSKLRPIVEQTMSHGKKGNPKGWVKSGASATIKDKTLLLKIQMKDVTKPPMWREVEVPSDMSFFKLHMAIQAAVGLDDYHLWQFNRYAYDESVQIGLPMDKDFAVGLEYVTDNAANTPVSAYLREVGDKLEYVYDFGDDWIFTVTVKKVLDRKSEHPVCTAYKSALNAMEDCGGTWGYISARDALDGWDKMKKKEREEYAMDAGFDSAEDYHDFLEDRLFDMTDVNEQLAEW